MTPRGVQLEEGGMEHRHARITAGKVREQILGGSGVLQRGIQEARAGMAEL